MDHFLTGEQILTGSGILVAFLIILVFMSLIKRSRKGRAKGRELAHKVSYREAPKKEIELPYKEEQAQKTTPWFDRLRAGLNQTRTKIVLGLDEFFISKQNKTTREEVLEYLFELLIEADVGVKTTELLVERIKNRVAKEKTFHAESFKKILHEEILSILNTTLENTKGTIENRKHTPHVVLVVGVNGAGKTTTTGKLAFKSHQNGLKAMIGAADTFRAAAVEQLAIWADRAKADMIRLKEGSDPASVAYEAVKKAVLEKADLCFIDTAGRLQTRHDLMQELSKIGRVVAKDLPLAPHEVLLVLDATTGQNALQQAKLFREAVNITGLILTKLDGTAKGGIAIAIASEMGLPIRYIGVGEAVEDLEIFNAQEFVDALFLEGSKT